MVVYKIEIMSKKYIAQINNTNFVYPNYKLAEYDVEIIHELKENSVSGTTSGFSILYNSGTGNLQLSFTYQWYLNRIFCSKFNGSFCYSWTN